MPLALPVMFCGWAGISYLGIFPSASGSQEGAHGSVDAHDTGTGPQTVEGGDITEPDHPFGMGGQFRKLYLVNELDGSIPASVAEDGLDGRVLQRPPDVADPFGDGACIAAVDDLAHMGTDDRLEPPSAQDIDGFLDVLHRREVGRGNQCHFVSGFQIAGLDAFQLDCLFRGWNRVVLLAGGKARSAGCGYHKYGKNTVHLCYYFTGKVK